MITIIAIEDEIIKLFPVFSAILIAIIGPIILICYKHRFYTRIASTKKKKEDFGYVLSVQEIVNDSLNNIQQKHSLDRVWIAQFHNGGNYYPGNKSMKKMSVSFESSAQGVAADIMRMQSLPISFFSACLAKLNVDENSGLVIDVLSEQDYALRSYWGSKGANIVYLFPIKSIDGTFIGILATEVIKSDEYLKEEVYNALLLESKILSGYVAALSIDKS
jgi:hypothetical protein